MWLLVCGGTATAYNATNAQIGVGDETVAAAATQAMLMAVANKTAWVASTAYALGAIVRPTAAPTDASVFYYECTTAGTSGTTEPAWPTTDGTTVTDNTAVWTARLRITYKAMETGYPTSGTLQKAVYKSSFGATEANYIWNEWSVMNGATAAKNMNRKVESLGTKTTGTWTLEVEISLS